jgi:hypothetical protein
MFLTAYYLPSSWNMPPTRRYPSRIFNTGFFGGTMWPVDLCSVLPLSRSKECSSLFFFFFTIAHPSYFVFETFPYSDLGNTPT